MPRFKYEVATAKGFVRCNDLRNAAEIYGFYGHARLERIDLLNGTIKTIKQK